MDKELSEFNADVRKKLFFLLAQRDSKLISGEEFMDMMKIWCAFSANDINNDNELDAQETKMLFWLVDGKKPTAQKIKREREIMDTDKSGTIDRLEWMAYLCSGSPTGGIEGFIDFELR